MLPAAAHLVVVGASAGGIEALSVLVSSLKAGFPAPLVIAQHLDPTRASSLAPILERRTELPVVLVQERQPLENGRIYVVPSNRHVVIQDGEVTVEGDHSQRPRPSIDLLLSSAARSYGERLIAVILTGSGSDGAAGAVDVKDAGGVVIIQNPQTAAYPSMPLALPPTAVDHVAELDAIGPLVQDLVLGSNLPEAPPGGHDALPELLALVSRHSGIDFRPYKPGTILRRIGRRMAMTRHQSIREYAEYLESNPEEVAELVMTLLIKVTEFFRDPEAYVYLRDEVMPQLIARGREQGQSLRVWSAGCASGEEAYSLALLIADCLGAELPQWSVKVFATDVDASAVNFARRGVYPANVVQNMRDGLRNRYFEHVDQGYRISKLLRQMVTFGQQDLTRGVPFPRIDLVVCRNLLIYFKPELQEEVLDIFAFSLHQTSGYLLLGRAETARPSRATFEVVSKKWKVYRCIHGPLPSTRPGPPALKASPAEPAARQTPAASSAPADFAPLDLAQLRRFNELALRGVGAGVIAIDRRYRILTTNPTGRRLLGIRDVASDQDFLHTVRGLPYDEVRSAIDRAFREHAAVMLPEVSLAASATLEPRHLSFHVAPPPSEGLAVDCVLLTVTDVTDRVQATRELETLRVEQRHFSEELSASNRRLTDMNKELQAANEELLLAQEELQATNEEFEATNEELQATNEELEANNEELQATNEELETTNEELHARTTELQELNRILTGERRLPEMVDRSPLFVFVLRGPSLLVEASNPASHQLLGGPQVVGKRFADVVRDPALKPLVAGAKGVLRRDRQWSSGRILTDLDVGGGLKETHELVYTVVPSHDARGKVEGVMIYAEDVSEQRAIEDRQRAEMLRVMIEHAHPAGLGLYDALSGRLLQASPHYMEILRRIAPTQTGRLDGTPFQSTTLLSSAQEADEALQTVRRSGRPLRISELRRHLPGDEQETIWDWTLIPIAFGEGAARQTRQVVVCVFEVTDQVRWREEVKKLDRVKDEFLAMASHELRTPLVPLTAYVDLLDNLLKDGSEAAPGAQRQEGVRLVGRMRKQIHDLTRLTDDLLDVGRLQSGTFSIKDERVDLWMVLEEARERASKLPDAPPIRLTGDRDAMIIKGDEGRLVQAVYNLIGNAVHHGAAEGPVDVRLARVGKAVARIEVQDYGPGIPAEDRDDLFTRFYRGRSRSRGSRGGLGLGLFICKQIVERHAGSIVLHSEPGKGTNFTIELPLDGVPPPGAAAATQEPAAIPVGPRAPAPTEMSVRRPRERPPG